MKNKKLTLSLISELAAEQQLNNKQMTETKGGLGALEKAIRPGIGSVCTDRVRPKPTVFTIATRVHQD